MGHPQQRGAVAALAFLLIAALTLQAAPASAKGLPRSPRVVTIITGERVLVGRANGVATARVLPSSRRHQHTAVTVARVAGDVYVIPASAKPYLSRYLDLNLFDVTRLAAAGLTARIPLRISYEPGTRPRIPGIRITSARGGVAHGYVTAASAQRFGAALAAQAYRDQRAGWPASSPLFGSVRTIAAAIAPPPTVVPNFPMVTLIVREVTPAGNPVRFGFGLLMNQDDGRKYIAFVLVVNGEARVSVPLGHYMGIFDDPTFGSGGGVTERIMPVADYLVSGAGQRLRIDAGSATVAPSLTTPKPSAGVELDVTINESDRHDHAEASFGFGMGFPGSRMLLEPTPPTTIGSLSEETRWIRVDPSTPGGRYLYDATYFDQGVPADQAHKVPWPGGTAQIDETYLADHLNALGATLRLVFAPGVNFAFASGIALPMPTHRTEYVVAPAGSTLDDVVLQNIQSFWDPGWFEDPLESADAGSVRSATWFRNPFSLGVLQPSAASQGSACWACRSDARMSFIVWPQDGDPTHVGFPFGGPRSFGPVARFSVYRNGHLLLRRTNQLGAIFSVPSAGGAYKVVSNLDRRLTGSFLSTHLHTEVSFRSAAGRGAPMPSGWYCFTGKTCTVLPVLTEGIDLHASPTGTLPLGSSTFDLTVGHTAGAEDPALTSVRVAVRRSGTSTWTTLPLTKTGAGQYVVHFTAAPSMDGRLFDLQVNATDAQGGALRQTTTHAFGVSA